MRRLIHPFAVIVSILIFIVIVFGLIFLAFRNTTPLNTQTGLGTNSDIQIDASKTPEFNQIEILTGLDHPWDIGFLSDERMIITERSGEISIVENGVKRIIEKPDDVFVIGEGGLLSLAVDSNFSENRFIYTCFNSTRDGLDVRVVRWELSEDSSKLENRVDIVTGMPSSQSGRHSGCQLEFGPDGYLWIGTGDAAIGTTPQDPKSLGGKILRIDRNGNAAEGNLGGEFDPRIYSYGHRNVQGIAFLKTTSSLNPVGVSAEHGPRIDDEINMLGMGNYGWDPVPGYNETVPMTDMVKYPDSIESLWSSGSPTIAISGITQINGEKWQLWNGSIAVGALIGRQVRILKFGENRLIEIATILRDIGRIRTVQQGPDENLYVLTDNGNNSDRILMLQPK